MKIVKHEVINMALLPSHNHVNIFGEHRIAAYNLKEISFKLVKDLVKETTEYLHESNN
jgi:hypothetical protein